MKNERADLPLRLLTAAVRAMPAGRVEWGLAMLAEMTYVHGPLARWRFALSCLPVVLFAPPGGGLSSMVPIKPTSIVATFAAASLISVVLVAPLAFLELHHNPLATSRRASDFVVLFGVLWVLPMVFVMTATPLVRAVRSGHTVLQSRPALGIKLTLLVSVAAMWLNIVSDQWPCFIGVPNCD